MSYPIPAFHFQAEWGGTSIGFARIRGLDQETEVIEYREGSSVSLQTLKIPGLDRGGRIILERGIILNRNDFPEWFGTRRAGTVERRDLTVSLLNEDHEPVVVWRVRGAWPAGLRGPELDAQASRVAFEVLEIVHEGIERISP